MVKKITEKGEILKTIVWVNTIKEWHKECEGRILYVQEKGEVCWRGEKKVSDRILLLLAFDEEASAKAMGFLWEGRGNGAYQSGV